MALRFMRIKEWNKHFECFRTRAKPNSVWSHVPIPNKFDGLGYKTIIHHVDENGNRDGAEIYTVFHLMVLVASRCSPRGTLARNGKPLSPQHLCNITAASLRWFEDAIPVLLSEDVGWIEIVDEKGNVLEPLLQDEESQEDTNSITATSPQHHRSISATSPSIAEHSIAEHSRAEHNNFPRSPNGGETRREKPSSPTRKTWTASDCEAIYRLYPKQVEKQDSIREIDRALARLVESGKSDPVNFLKSAVDRYAAVRKTCDAEYTPSCRRWMHGSRWEDDPKAWTDSSRSEPNKTRTLSKDEPSWNGADRIWQGTPGPIVPPPGIAKTP